MSEIITSVFARVCGRSELGPRDPSDFVTSFISSQVSLIHLLAAQESPPFLNCVAATRGGGGFFCPPAFDNSSCRR